MSLYEALKDAANLARKADNLDLLQRLLDAQQQLLDLQESFRKKSEEVSALNSEVARLKQALEVSGSVTLDHGWYFQANEDGSRKYPPLCSRCWQIDGRQVFLQNRTKFNRDGLRCAVCKAEYGPVRDSITAPKPQVEDAGGHEFETE